MKKTLLLLSVFITHAGFSQEHNEKYLEKVKTLDAAIATLYGVISGEAGEKRNWELFRYLFAENAKLIPSGKDKNSEVRQRFLSPEAYIKSSGSWLEKNGFFEKEIHRKTETFGSLAHVFSTYEAFRTKQDPKPFVRGINSIQLLYDGNRWWVINIYWTPETPENPIPESYLPENYTN